MADGPVPWPPRLVTKRKVEILTCRVFLHYPVELMSLISYLLRLCQCSHGEDDCEAGGEDAGCHEARFPVDPRQP